MGLRAGELEWLTGGRVRYSEGKPAMGTAPNLPLGPGGNRQTGHWRRLNPLPNYRFVAPLPLFSVLHLGNRGRHFKHYAPRCAEGCKEERLGCNMPRLQGSDVERSQAMSGQRFSDEPSDFVPVFSDVQ